MIKSELLFESSFWICWGGDQGRDEKNEGEILYNILKREDGG